MSSKRIVKPKATQRGRSAGKAARPRPAVSRKAVSARSHGGALVNDRAAREEAIHQHYADRPSLDTMRQRGDISKAGYRAAQQLQASGPPAWPLQELVRALRAERERQGLSLADVAERTGIGRAAINKIELGINRNPTAETLERYALALGKRVKYTLAKTRPGAPQHS
jgi:DNA-binding XRE family transcriptional regulator